ncbi:MAG: type II secretion system protein [Nitrospirota bacterium]
MRPRRSCRHGVCAGHDVRGASLVELLIVIVIVGILAGMGFLAFLTYRARTYQAEAAVNLAGIYAAERVFFAEAGRYSHFSDIGFALTDGVHRYTYRTHGTTAEGQDSGEAQIPAAVGPVTPENGLVPSASGPTGFTATATADLDVDAVLDQWHVNDRGQGVRKPDVNDAE